MTPSPSDRATALTIAGGGAGGVFIPLVVQGWLLGSIVETSLHTHTSLFPVIGAAAFLGAGYRTPIAAVVFVAETTGRPGFVVPALVATAVAQPLFPPKPTTILSPMRSRPTHEPAHRTRSSLTSSATMTRESFPSWMAITISASSTPANSPSPRPRSDRRSKHAT